MSNYDPERQSAVERHTTAAEAMAAKARLLEISAATMRAATELVEAGLLDRISYDIGEQVSLDDLAQAGAEIADIAGEQRTAANRAVATGEQLSQPSR